MVPINISLTQLKSSKLKSWVRLTEFSRMDLTGFYCLTLLRAFCNCCAIPVPKHGNNRCSKRIAPHKVDLKDVSP